MAKETALAKVEQYAILQRPTEQVKRVMQENVGGEIRPFELERVSIPAGGGTAWEVPTLEGVESREAIEGVVIHWQDVRVYWAGEYGGGNQPPDCYSEDGETGIGEPGGLCADCPFAEWGSAEAEDSRGQACKQVRRLFVVRPDELLPLLISLPPTSLAATRKYFHRLASRAVPFYGVVTRLALVKAKNAQGIGYSVVLPSVASRLDDEMLQRFAELRSMYKPVLSTVGVSGEDYEAGEEGEGE